MWWKRVPSHVEKGQFAEALADIEKYTPEDTPWDLAYVFGRFGHLAEAKRALEKVEQLNHRQSVDPAAFAWAHVGMGNKDQAFAWLQRAYLRHSNILTTLKVEPGFDSLRSDPRFQEMMRRVGLVR